MKDRCHFCPIKLDDEGEHVRDPKVPHPASPRYSENERGTTVKLFEYDDSGKCVPA